MRVAALLPAATDIVIALGAGDQLVAVTHACSLPPALAAVPRVTHSHVDGGAARDIDRAVAGLADAGAPLFDVDEALLAAQHPGVLVTQAACDVCAVREEDVRAVAARLSPPARVLTLGGSTVEGVLADIVATGDALGLPDEAEELVDGLRARLQSVHRRLKAAQAPRPRVAVVEWVDPVFGAGHWVPDMVRRAGGLEVTGQAGAPSRRATSGQLRAAAPEVLIVAPCGLTLEESARQARQLLADGAWAWAGTVPVWALDANALTSSPSPAIVRGIEVLASILHPALFGEPPSRSARAVRASDP